MKKKSHFSAVLSFYKTEDGGIVTPISTDIRLMITLPLDTNNYNTHTTFLETELVYSGDTVIADMMITERLDVLEKLYDGMDFEIMLASNIIGSGVITKVYRTENS